MTEEEKNELVEKYFNTEGYEFPTYFEHRYDEDSSAIAYSLVRYFKPQTVLHIGTWEGGSTCVIAAALLMNKQPFVYVASELLKDKKEKTAQHCLEKNGITPMIIGDITQNLDKIPSGIDFLFIDTSHDLETTKWIVENVFPRMKEEGLVAIHDWAVKDEGGEWMGKRENGVGGWPETEYLLQLHREDKLPLEKLYWMYGHKQRPEGYENREGSFWLYKPAY